MNRRIIAPVFVALALLFGVAAPSALRAQTGEPAVVVTADDHLAEIEEARALVHAMMEESGVPGVSVAVGLNGRILWSEGFGWADLEQSVPVSTLTKFRVGSVSKPMTAAAIAILMDEGRLDLDAPVQEYVPNFPEKRWPVTTRMAAGHVAGIRHYRGEEMLSAVRYPDVISGLAIFQDDPLEFEPGTDYSYSSYGWNLVSAVVEGAAGEPFLAYMRDRVFEPLGMRHTAAGHTDSIVVDRTRFYERGEDGRILNAPYVDNSYKWAGGGFLSTPEDLIRFGTAHLGPVYTSAESLETLFRSQQLNSGEATGYGIGWMSSVNDRGQRIVSHTGGSVGGTTVLLVNRDLGLVVAAVGNMSSGPIPGLGREIAEVFTEALSGTDASGN